MRFSTFLAAMMAILGTPDTIAHAQVAAPQATACELHVWPAARMNSATVGLLGGGGIVGRMLAGPDRNNLSEMATTLDPATQLEELQSLSLPAQLGLPDGTILVRHEALLDRHAQTIRTRRSDSTSSCYYELQTDVIDYQASIYARTLRAQFTLRMYGNDQHIDMEYTGSAMHRLHHFPPQAGEDVTLATDELAEVFKRNFQDYAVHERDAMRRHLRH